MEKITNSTKLKHWTTTINDIIDSVNKNTISISKIPTVKNSIEDVELSDDGLFWVVENKDEEVKINGTLPLGHMFTWPFKTPPSGCIIANGSEYNRLLYKDLWDYISTNLDWIKTEEEWQEIASSNNGYCSYYSTGDGSTTFRTPKFAPYQQLIISPDLAGNYHEAGLPNIKGTIVDIYGGVSATKDGAFKETVFKTPTILNENGNKQQSIDIKFSANDYNKIYSDSINTVQPESSGWIVCIVAYGTINNTGNIDIEDIVSSIDVMTGATDDADGTTGFVPSPKSGEQDYVLKGNGQWGKIEPALFKGAIISYSGSFQDKNPIVDGIVHDDCALCDGSNGTPNLVNKFIRGTNADGIGGTGGADSQNVSIPVKGTVSGLSVGATTLSINQMPSHNHDTTARTHASSTQGSRGLEDYGDKEIYTSNTGGSQSHTHSISGTGTISGTTSATVNTVPSYYALAYIMKIK